MSTTIDNKIAIMRTIKVYKKFLFTNAVSSGIAALDAGYNGFNKVAGLLRSGQSFDGVMQSSGSLECFATAGFAALGILTFSMARNAGKMESLLRKEIGMDSEVGHIKR
jgi:hypothetical protein